MHHQKVQTRSQKLKNFCTVKLAGRVVTRQGEYYRPLTCVENQSTRQGELVCARASCANLAVTFSKILITPHLPTLSARVFTLIHSQTSLFILFFFTTNTNPKQLFHSIEDQTHPCIHLCIISTSIQQV
jgi:hypothetical protein